MVMRQALAGMLWSKQFYFFDVNRWLEERGARPASRRRASRAPQRPVAPHVQRRRHLHAGQVGVSVVRGVGSRLPRPRAHAGGSRLRQAATGADAARASTCIRTGRCRPTSGTSATSTRRSTPGPRSSPIVGASAHGTGDIVWLERCFQKLLLNFTWWVNRKDRSGKNIFEGGFLGLDNIGVFDRSAPLPTGGYLEQADGTAWMALFCQNMLEIAIELADARPGLRGAWPASSSSTSSRLPPR